MGYFLIINHGRGAAHSQGTLPCPQQFRPLRFRTSAACRLCNPSLSAEICPWLPCICRQCDSLLPAEEKLQQQRPTCYNSLGDPSQRTWVQPQDGIFFLSLIHNPSLTLTPVPMCSKLLLQGLVCNTKELLLSVEHIFSAQRASVVLSKLKQSCAKTLGGSE